MPYEIDVQGSVNTSNSTVVLTFINTGGAAVVFHVRSGNPADPVRYYTVEPGKTLAGVWNADSTYDLFPKLHALSHKGRLIDIPHEQRQPLCGFAQHFSDCWY